MLQIDKPNVNLVATEDKLSRVWSRETLIGRCWTSLVLLSVKEYKAILQNVFFVVFYGGMKTPILNSYNGLSIQEHWVYPGVLFTH